MRPRPRASESESAPGRPARGRILLKYQWTRSGTQPASDLEAGGTQAQALRLASEIIIMMMIIAHCRIFNFMFKFTLIACERRPACGRRGDMRYVRLEVYPLRAYCSSSRYKLVYTDVFIVLIALLSFEATRCCLSSIRHDGA